MWKYKWWLPLWLQPESCHPTLEQTIHQWQAKIGKPGYKFTSSDYQILRALDEHLEKGGKKIW